MAQNLFEDFLPVSAKQWKQKIQYELKGADYNQTVIWNTAEDIQIKPFYNSEDSSNPLQTHKPTSGFSICQNIFVHDLNKSITRAQDALNRGATSLCFTIENETLDVEKLLNALPLQNIVVYFHFQFLSIDFVKRIEAIAKINQARIYCKIDPIGHLAKDGNWLNTSEKNNFETLEKIFHSTEALSILSIDGSLYQNAGATIVQELAYGIAHFNEYYHHVPSLKNSVVFNMAIGSNYFFEIAKFRALRILFDTLQQEYGSKIDFHLLATPSKRNKTIYDYNVNMLRTTTECMSAILGGADTIANLPYDVLFHKDNEFGDRIARNQLLILKEEAYFDKVNNPADGSYYIESITQQLAEKALQLFKEIEKNGGFLKLLQEGIIQKKIHESADKAQETFDTGKNVLVGTNKYPNKNDQMKNDLQLYPFVKIKPRKTLITPIIEKRLAEKSEQERLNLEQ